MISHLRAASCYVSLVAFLFDKVRVKGFAIPLHTRFEEINLRFYVRRREPDGSIKRGVVFIREFVPRRAIAWVAKRFYEEPYLAVPTRSEISSDAKTLTAKYGWKLGGRWHTLSAAAYLPPQAIAPGSEEEFLTEHYWGYTKRSDGSTSAYQVEHPRWQTYRLQSYEIAVDFETSLRTGVRLPYRTSGSQVFSSLRVQRLRFIPASACASAEDGFATE